jgi:hypothetical protein
MPRKSAASLAVVPPVVAPREPAPAHLAPEEAAEWRKVVESLPAHWFPGASFTLLEIYVQAAVTTRWLAARLAPLERGSPEWKKWHALWVMEAKLAAQLAVRLRLHPRWDRSIVRKVPTGPRPWDKPPAA